MRAKMMITEVLDTTTNSRVTMKMDVSYTDHSHIIGKGGNTIRRVMAETNCHIHFPDSNRSNPNEKSNQVMSSTFGLLHNIHYETLEGVYRRRDGWSREGQGKSQGTNSALIQF